MNKTIRVKIVTPNNIILDAEALMVTLPGEAGELGVLPEHTRLISSLQEGLVKIFLSSPVPSHSQEANIPTDNILKIFVSASIAEITATNVNIVADSAKDVTNG